MAQKSFFRILIEIAESMDGINNTMFAGDFEANLEADRIKEEHFPLCIINNSLDVENEEQPSGIVYRNIPFAVSFLALDDLDSTALQQQDILDQMEVLCDTFINEIKKSGVIPPDQLSVFDSWTTNNQVKIYDATLTGMQLTGTVPYNTGIALCSLS